MRLRNQDKLGKKSILLGRIQKFGNLTCKIPCGLFMMIRSSIERVTNAAIGAARESSSGTIGNQLFFGLSAKRIGKAFNKLK